MTLATNLFSKLITPLVAGLLLALATTSQANNWLAEAQLLAQRKNDAQALSLLWGKFKQQPTHQQETAYLLIADLCARNGLFELARSYYLKRLAADTVLASGDRYAIARFFADEREWNRVQTALNGHWQQFPSTLKHDAQNLLGFAALQNGNPNQAKQLLEFRRHHTGALPYRRHNLAVAQYQLGKTFESRKALQQLAAQPAYTLEQAVFKDRLAVQLAQHYLKYEQGRFAEPLLQHIKYHSPYANSALLLLGWAALTPGGEQAECVTLAVAKGCWIDVDAHGRDIQFSKTSISQTFAALRPAKGEIVSGKTLQRLNQAISSWSLLADKTSTYTGPNATRETLAQLEAQVSLGYALQASGHLNAAQQRYKQALTSLQQAPLAPNKPQAESWQAKLEHLKQAFEQQPAIPSQLQQRVLASINSALQYRQQDQARLQQKADSAWRNATIEYRKQAHLGLASLHEQMSYARR